MDWIRINGLELDCILGIWPKERLCEQRIRLDLAMAVDTKIAAQSGRIAHTVRYDVVAEQLALMLCFRRYFLIEAAVEELACSLFALHPLVKRIQLRIEKPKALEGRAQSASVEIERAREELVVQRRLANGASEATYLTTRLVELTTLTLAAGQEVKVGRRGATRTLWLVADGQLGNSAGRLVAGQSLCADNQSDGAESFLSAEPSLLFICRELASGDETAR